MTHVYEGYTPQEGDEAEGTTIPGLGARFAEAREEELGPIKAARDLAGRLAAASLVDPLQGGGESGDVGIVIYGDEPVDAD